MKKIVKNPLFLLGLLIRILMIAIVLPQAAAQWYVPFLNVTVQHFSWNPWQTFLLTGGSNIAFPYGYVMWMVFLPLTWLSHILQVNSYYAYGLTLLFFDFSLLLILRKLFNTRINKILFLYWLSPIILFTTYWLGLNDLIPVTLLCLALYFSKNLKLFTAGIFCGAAISAKLSMILAIPFFCIYLYRNNALRRYLPSYLLGLFSAFIVLCLPFILSAAGLSMLLHNPEMEKIYQLVLKIGDTVTVYLLPMLYLLMLYLTWWVRRMSFELLNIFLGLSFFLVLLLTPAAPGWFIWIIPLLVLYQILSGRMAIILVTIFTLLFVIYSFLLMPSSLILGTGWIHLFALWVSGVIGKKGLAILYTVLLTSGVIVIFRIWNEAVRSNYYFRLSRKPFVIGISGDSGSGKDTLANALEDLLGYHSVTKLSGDDYHLWDRQKPMWQVMTHLNPRANNLEQYAQDLISLANRKTIYSRHYDHETGKMTHLQRVRSNDYIVASGLHALYLPILRSCYNLSIYLDIDEDLRRYFKLERDIKLRGHTKEHVLSSLDNRAADSQKFVRPQAAYADLIMSLRPLSPNMLQAHEAVTMLHFKLVIYSRQRLNEEALIRVLVGVCGLHVDMNVKSEGELVELTIEGDTMAEDIALAAAILFPNMADFLDPDPHWKDGILGLMQLIVISHIDQAMRKRLL